MSSEESLKQTLLIIDWVDLNTVDPGFKTLYLNFSGYCKDQLFISYTKLLLTSIAMETSENQLWANHSRDKSCTNLEATNLDIVESQLKPLRNLLKNQGSNK